MSVLLSVALHFSIAFQHPQTHNSPWCFRSRQMSWPYASGKLTKALFKTWSPWMLFVLFMAIMKKQRYACVWVKADYMFVWLTNWYVWLINWYVWKDVQPKSFKYMCQNSDLRTFEQFFFTRWCFFHLSLRTDNDLLVSEMK